MTAPKVTRATWCERYRGNERKAKHTYRPLIALIGTLPTESRNIQSHPCFHFNIYPLLIHRSQMANVPASGHWLVPTGDRPDLDVCSNSYFHETSTVQFSILPFPEILARICIPLFPSITTEKPKWKRRHECITGDIFLVSANGCSSLLYNE